ncbi:hypothetical protein M0R45_015340 [Rubus argutus]|uniref:Disease resistance RPP13-like protein 1 n=1 Tax=Rubus argutus TaxID=59490 RepID=A0AAW1XSQ0_RUBAR
MALAVVGGALLSSFLAVLFDRMASRPVVDFIKGQKITTGLLQKLKMKLWEWLDELKDVLYHADDLLDEIKTEALSRKLEEESGSSSTNDQVLNSIHEFDKSLEPRILEILNRLDFIVNEKDVLNLKEGVKDRLPARLPTTSLVEESGVYGRDEDKETIVKLLLADDLTGNKTSVVPIVGMGGIGKTTLAQLVYNDDRVKQHFDHQSWFCVSEEFDVIKITQTIYRSITRENCNIIDLDMLQVKLKTTLAGKKFIFVLDDVWNVNYMEWDLLTRPFVDGGHGSKIIITTRNEGVACTTGTLQSRHLMELSEEDCWLLFAKHASKDPSGIADPCFEGIGRQIAQKCKGLPLAAKSLGGLLRSEPNIEEWKKILNNDIWELQDKENDILPALWLSYHYLPPHLKRCFAYCSIFPQDYKFTKSKLILLWMAEDLVQSKKKATIEEVGESYFDDLISRSFFQLLPDYFGATSSRFVMHDLINDLAKFVTREFCIRLENNDSVLDNVSKTRHLCINSVGDFVKWGRNNEARHLRTILVLNPPYTQRPDLDFDIFLKLQCLRVLDLSGYYVGELPDSICKLKHLRHFDLSQTSIRKLPDKMCSLYNLQTLLLRNCRDLTELPTDLGRLINLRHLDISGTYKIKRMPTRMGKLKDLQTFRGKFVLDKYTAGNIVELKELEHLRETLCISGLRNVVHVADALKTDMRRKKDLDELVLEWGGESSDADDSEKERQVLGNLQPHANVKHLAIRSYGGTRFPGSNPLPNLRKLTVRWCPKLTGRFILDYFPKLESLELKDVDIESLTISQESNSPKLLPLVHLRALAIVRCSKLRSLPHEMHTLLPSLTRLSICNCPKLEPFPEEALPSKLESLHIISCKKLIGNLMQWGLSTLTSLLLLRVSLEGFADSFPNEGLLPTTLTKLYIYRISRLDGKGFRQLTSLKKLSIEDCSELQCLPEEGLPTSLSYLRIYGCPLLEQRCQRETGEDWAKIAHIKTIWMNDNLI